VAHALLRLVKIGIVCLVVTLAWLALHVEAFRGVIDSYQERQEYRRHVKDAREEMGRLDGERSALARGEFLAEKLLRERFLYAKPGEKVLLLKSEESASEKTTAATDPVSG